MIKRLPKSARSELVRWDSATGQLTFGIPATDYDADIEAMIKAAKTRLADIEKLLAQPPNKQAKLLAREKRQLETLIQPYGRPC
jgi:predicted trehalose synthase